LGWKRHPAHFSVEQAIEASKRIGARLTRFTHIAHSLGHEETNKLLPEGMRLGFDGERVHST
jgi:phosphoribosyl 1,2-cyclic phosphate phosphodiesterase